MLGMSEPLRTARAQAVIDKIDAGAGAGSMKFYSGGRPDDDKYGIASIVAHAISAAYSTGDYAESGGHYYRADNAGTSAGSAPVFPTNGSTVADNDITWQHMGEVPVLLGTLTLSDPCGTAATGLLTFSAVTEDAQADADGIAAFALATDSDASVILSLLIGGTGSGAQIEMNTTTVVKNGPIRVNTASILEGNKFSV